MKKFLLVLLLCFNSIVSAIEVNPPFNVKIQNINDAFLTWVAPTQNTDNSPLTDLAGFKIYYGTNSGSYTETIDINSATLTGFLIENLANSTWYFAMTAYNSSGIESTYSTEVSKVIP
jgi:hypothetical protein